MGCGMSKSNLMDEGMGVFASRNPNHHHHHHHKTNTASPKLLITNTPKASIIHQPPMLQKINTNGNDGRKISNDGQMRFGSPSFREYVQSVPDDDDDDDANKGDGQGKEIVIDTHEGKHLTCNGEVCVWVDPKEKEQSDNKDTRVGRFRKVFQVHRAICWHGPGWHPGHPKATRKAA